MDPSVTYTANNPYLRYFARLKHLFSAFGLAITFLSVIAIGLSALNTVIHQQQFIGPAYLIAALILGWFGSSWGMGGFIFLLPLTPNFHAQLQAFLGISITAQPNPGLDLAAGFIVGIVLRSILGKNPASKQMPCMPWQVGLALSLIGFSACLAIVRNLRQSASSTSFEGIFFNLTNFRSLGWHDDFMPLADLIAYGLAGAVIAVMLPTLMKSEKRNRLVFQPLMAGIGVAAMLGIIQAVTGYGLPEALLNFRNDRFGFVAIGFQPDIHAFAGHMLIGAVGLWGYFFATKSKDEKYFTLLIIGLAWLALLLSKSRATLILACFFTLLGTLYFIWQYRRAYFKRVILSLIVLGLFVLGGLFYLLNHRELATGLGWLTQLINKLNQFGIAGLSEATQNFGGRPEIYTAALRMWSEFPLMGLGQGGFFRQSAEINFSHSFMLARWGGENAHNYFLQVLVENGLIGFAIMGFAVIAPFFIVAKRRDLLPSALGLTGLLLANILAHSLLIRENLILAAVLLSLMYSWAFINPKVKQVRSNSHLFYKPIFVIPALVILLGTAVFEIYQSFYRFPYQTGLNCMVARPLTNDGWTSGIFEVALPIGTKGVEIDINQLGRTPADLLHRPLGARIDIVSGKWVPGFRKAEEGYYSYDHPSLAHGIYLWQENRPTKLKLTITESQIAELNNDKGKAILRLTSCFVPRDLGVSLDSRRLGIQVQQVQTF